MNYRSPSKVLAIAFAAMSAGVHAEEPAYTAKALFFGADGDMKTVATEKMRSDKEGNAVAIATAPKKTPQKPKNVVAKKAPESRPLGAAYFVRLKKPNGATEDALLGTRIFSTGDRFQLGLKVNRPSYVYIFNEDPDGRITMLHPRPGGSAAVSAMGTVFLPTQGSFEFQGEAGTEKLLVLMSKEEMLQPDAVLYKAQPDLVAGGSPSACKVMVADAGNYASKAIVYSQDTSTANVNCKTTAAPLYASKAIVFADDPQPAAGQQLASYVVKPETASKAEPLLLKIQLSHH
jgi:hypothetical protein